MNFKKNKTQISSSENNLINQSSPNPISMAKLIQENENLSLALKQEILKNEEQENYIQILKETIENNLNNNGLAELLTSSKEYQQFQEYNKDQGKTMADFVVDFIKFKEENNKDIKNGDKDGIINDLNKEVIRLDNENKNLKNKIYLFNYASRKYNCR